MKSTKILKNTKIVRSTKIMRKTAETNIILELTLDGRGTSNIKSGCGFFDHMLTLFAKHGRFHLDVVCEGDSYVDYHHTVEDIGICLGKAFLECLGDKKGITRYADTTLVMDEALILSAVDISGRGGLFYSLEIPTEKVGDFDTELCKEFFNAFTRDAQIGLHLKQLAGENSHHIIEGAFKSVARSLRKAITIEEEYKDEIPSTKGSIG